MMKKRMRAMGAILLTASMLMGMSTAAMAENAARDAAVTSEDTTLKIKKEIAYFNPDGKEINYPAVGYTYSVAPAEVSSGTKVTDSANKSANVKSGIAGGVVMGTDSMASIAAGKISATSTGALVSDTFDINVDLTKFSVPGIYRYEITENAPDNLAALGYEAATTHLLKRYLDVYIENGTSGLKVAGYTLFLSDDANKSITSSDNGDKTEGFVHEKESDYSDDTDVDKYKTFNVEISKTITGTLADKTHEFPFYASISQGTATASTVTITGAVEDTSKGTDKDDITLVAGAANNVNIANLKDSGKVTLIGIPVGSTVSLSEKNDTTDTYTVSATGLTNGPSGALEANATSTAGTVTTAKVEEKSVSFINNLDAPSPTGVVLRFAPYLFIFACAVVLLAMSSRRRVY